MENQKSIWTMLFRTPHRLGFADANGVQTRYLEAGQRGTPAVIMLHGGAGSLENFCANIEAFSKHFNVFAIDMLGSGWTDKPDYPYTPDIFAKHIVAFMDAVGIEKASFFGIALGTVVSAYMARDHKSRVEKLILVAPGGIVHNQEELAKYLAGARDRRANASAETTRETVREVFVKMFKDPSRIIEDLIDVRFAFYSDPESKRAMPNMLASAKPEYSLTWDEWRGLQCPILAFAPSEAPGPFARNARLIGELAPNATVVEIDECNVWAQFERAEFFNETAIAFLRGN